MELSLLQLRPRVGYGHWIQERPSWRGLCCPQLLDHIIRKAQTFIQSHSTCTTVLDKNWVISRLPVTPSTSVSPADLLPTPASASASWFPQKRQGRLTKNYIFPGPRLRKFGTLSPLPSLSPLPALLGPQEHAHVHTPESPFHTAHLPPQASPLPCPPPAPQLSELEGAPKIIGFFSPHPEPWFGYLPYDPSQDISTLFLYTSRDGEFTTSQDNLLPLDCSL